jgi:hypothetical protein
MLWWIAGFIVVVIALRMLSHWRHGMPVMQDLIEPPTHPATFRDPQLGVLTYSLDGKCWECTVARGDGANLELSIAGKATGPDPAALEAARPLAARAKTGELQASIKQQAAEQAPSLEDAKDPVFAAQRTEMLSLEVDGLHVHAAGPPPVCMVFFKEKPAHEGRLWRCQYDGERVADWGFDS